MHLFSGLKNPMRLGEAIKALNPVRTDTKLKIKLNQFSDTYKTTKWTGGDLHTGHSGDVTHKPPVFSS